MACGLALAININNHQPLARVASEAADGLAANTLFEQVVLHQGVRLGQVSVTCITSARPITRLTCESESLISAAGRGTWWEAIWVVVGMQVGET